MRRFLSRRVLGEFLAVTGSCSVAAVGYAQQPAAQPDPKDNPAPSTQPAKPDSGELPAATQRAMNDRLRRLQEMRAAASQNGKNVTDAGSKQEPAPESAPAAKPATPPASNRWRERNAAQTQPVVNPEEIRRRAMEARNRAAAGEAQSQPVPAVPQPAGGPEGGREIEPQPTGRDVVVPSKIPDVQHPTEPTTAPPAMEEHKPETAPLTPATVPTTRPPARPARFQPKPATAPSTPLPGAVPPPGDASAKIDQPAVVPPAADGKSDWIAFKDMPWEDVVRLMAKRIGKPLREDIGVMPGGSLTYENPRVMTKEEALDELNYLLVEAGYYLFETRYYVYCVPLNEIRRYLDPSRIFDSIEEFAAAKPRDMELVDVKILIKDMPAEKIRDALAPALPDYAMPTVVAGTNSISITGLGKDVRRFELLHSRIDPREMAKQDPRQMKVYGIKTNVLVIERMVRDLLDVEQPQRKFNPQTRQFEVQGGDSATKIIADERTNTLIVKATPAEHDKVQALIDQFDKVVDIGKFKTTVVEIKNGNAQEIATLLNNIFSQERGQQQPGRFSFRQPVVRQPNQPGQPGQPGQPNVVISGGANPEDIIVEDIFERAKKTVRITADDRSNSLIIYANDEGLARVNEMLEIIDKPVPSNYRPFATKYVDPSDLQPVIEQIARSAMVPNRSGRGSRQPSVIADDGSRILHVVAEKEDMERIAELIGKLDVPAAEQKEHRIQLTQLKPSDMAQTVQGMLSGAAGGGSPRPGRQGGQPRRGGSGSTAQVIALDEISTLIVMCTDAEWEKVRGTIELWDKSAVSDKPEMRFITISKGNPDAILQTIGNLYRNYRHPILGQQPVLTDLSGDKLVVQGIKPALDEIEGLVAKLDVESGGTPVVIIPLAAADANTVAQLLAQQFQSSGGRMRGGRGPVVNADGATNSIIYQGDKQNLEIARKFIQDYEKELVGQGSEKRTFVIKFASPDQVLNAVNQFFVNTGSGRLGPKAQVRAALSANQLIVEAPKDKLAAIETMINTIDNPLPQPTTELRPVPGALDINNLAQMMNTMFRGRQRPDRLTFSFGADLTTSMLVMTVPKDALPEVDAVLKQFIDQAGNVELIEKFIPIQHADVNYVADQVRQLLQARSSPGRGSTVADKVKTVVDSRLNRLGVYAPANLIPLVEELVKQIDQVTTGGEIQSIPMQYADAQGAVQTVSNLLAEKLRLNKNLKVTAEPLSNTIFVAGANKGDFDEIKKQAEQIDANALANRPETRIFEIININPWEILNSLNQRFNQAGGGRRQSAMTFNVVAGTKIVAVVPKDRVEDVAAYVKLLDEASPLPPVQGIALKQADAGTVAQILSNLLQPQMQTNKSLRIVPEPLSNTIFVSGATGPLFKDIEKWAGDLDQATLTRGAEIRVFPIKNGVPQEIVSVLNSRYQPRTGVRIINANQPTFTVVATSNIVASAPPEKLEEIAKLIEQLDTLPGSDWPTVTYDLKYVDPNETMQMINNLYRGKGNQGQQPQVSIGNGMLIIRAPQKAQDEIASLIKKIEVDRGDLAVEMFDLKLMRAQELEAKINLFLGGLGMTPKKGQMRPGAFAEPTTNTLIVMAPKEHMGFIKMLIAGIDNKELPESEPRSYNLQFVRAETVAQNVEAMLKAKIIEKEGPKNDRIQLKVLPEPSTNRLFVWAPDEYHELARALLKMVDAQGESGEIVRIVHLEQADSTQMANTVKGRIGSGKSAPQVNVVPDVGSNCLILSGMPKDVADAEKLINELEPLNNTTPELQIFSIQNSSAISVADALADIFPAQPKNPLDAVTVREDEFYNRLFVTANKRKMRQVEEMIKVIDVVPAEEVGGREIYFIDITRGDPWDIAFDVADHFPPESEGGPRIDSAFDGDYIKVWCRPSEYPKIEKLIREYDLRAKPELKTIVLKPKGGAAKYLPILRAQGRSNLKIDDAPPGVGRPTDTLIEDLWPEGTKAEDINKLRGSIGGKPAIEVKQSSTQPAGKVVPAGDIRFMFPMLIDDPRQEQDWTGKLANELLRGDRPQEQETLPESSVAAVDTQPSTAPVSGGKEARITALPDGRVIISGDKGKVEDLQDAISLLEEDLAAGEVIRIFRFRFGDVTAAARILEMMFNASAQMRGAAGIQQMMQQQQQMMQQQMQQAQQQQRRGDEEGGRGGRRGGGAGGGGGLMDTLRGMTGAGGGRTGSSRGQQPQGDRLRIATDISHNYLIVKCDESDLPEIRQLLRELDIPPANVEVKVIQLKKLNATETAANIRDVLGITEARASRERNRGGNAGFFGSPFGRGGMGGMGGMQNQFMELFTQQMVSLPGLEGEGAKIDSVQIVPNEISNSIMLSAPKEVVSIIEKVINELENLEGQDVVVIRHYKLKQARVEDIEPLLQEIFDATSGGRGGQGGGRGGQRAVSPAQLGLVTVRGDTRNNTLIVSAQQKDLTIIEKQIELMDIEGDLAEAETYACQYGDATAIAQAVSDIFGGSRGGGGGARGGGRGAGGAAAGVTSDVRITAEAVTNRIIVFGSPQMREKVFDQIKQLDEGSKRDIQEIEVVHADPEKLADKLLAVFGGVGGSNIAAGGRGAGGRGGRADLSQISGRIVVMGDKISKKILIRAPKPIFEQMAELCVALDQPDPGLQVQLFPIKHGDAQTLVDSVKAAFLEYMTVARQGGSQDTSFDAFTILADPRTNSIMVVGSEQTFQFVGQLLKVVDVETPADQAKEFRIFTLTDADAQTVADSINAFASGQAAAAAPAGRGAGGQGGRGGNPLQGMMRGASLGGQTLNVQATADPDNNAVLVFGKPSDIDVIEKMVIDKLETTLAKQVKALPCKNADPSQIVSFIQPFIEEAVSQAAGRPGGQRGMTAGGPVVIPNDNAKHIVVRGTSAEIRKVEELVAQFDDPTLVDNPIEIIPIPVGQDINALAMQIEQLVNTGERSQAQKQGRIAREIAISANEYSNALMVYGDPSLYGMVKAVVQQVLEIRPSQPSTVVLKLDNLSAQDAQNIINDLQQRRLGGRSGTQARPAGFNRPGGTGGTGGFNRPGGGQPTNRGAGGNRPTGQPNQPRRQPTGGGGRGANPHSGDEGAWLWPSSDAHSMRGPILSYKGEPFLLTFYGGNFPAGAIFGDDSQDSAPAEHSKKRAPRRGISEVLPVLFGSDSVETDQAAKTVQEDKKPASRPRTQPRRPTTLPEGRPPVRRVAETPNAPVPPTAMQTAADSQPTSLTGLTGQLRGDVVATPLDSKTIVVTGNQEDVAFIEQVLSLLEASAPSPVIEVIPLKHAKAGAIQQAIDQTMRAMLEAAGGGSDRGDRYSIIAESRYNALIASASEKNMETIKFLVEQLDQQIADATPRLVALKNIQATEAADLLKPVIEQIKAVRGESQTPPPSVQPVKRSNAVMLIGNPAEVSELEEILKSIDVEIPPTESFSAARIQMVDLKNAIADDLAKTLNDLIAVDRGAGGAAGGGGSAGAKGESIVRRLMIKTPDGQELPPLDLDRPIKILPDKARNALVIYSSQKNLEALQTITQAFDTLPVGEEIDVKSFVLQHAQAQKLAETLNKMFDDAKKTIGRAADLSGSGKEKGVMPPQPQGMASQGLPFNVIATPDPRSNSLIVIGRKPSVLLAAGLIAEIDKPSTNLGVQPHMLMLKNTDAVGMEQRLRDMLDKRADALGGKDAAARDNAVLMLDERSNSIMVLANDDTWAMIQALAQQIDQLDSQTFVLHKYHKLEYADPIKLGGLVQDVFDKKKEARQSSEKSGQKDTLAVLPDSRSNALVLTGTKDYVEEAEALIQELDQPMAGRVEFKIRPMVLGSASNAAKLLDDMVKKSREQSGGSSGKAGQSTPVHIAADALTNSLLLAASKEDMVLLEHWVDLLDRPTEFGRIQRIVPLTRGSSDDLSKAIGDLFKQSGGQGGSSGQDMTVFADKTTNSVVLSGPPQLVEEAVTLLRKMQDAATPGGAVVRIFKLDQADAAASGELLRSILEGRGGSVGGTGTGSRTTGGSTGARDEAAQQVVLLYEKVSGDGKGEILKGFRQEVTVIDDVRTNSLVITAPGDAMPLMETLVKAIDVPPDAAKIRVFPLRNSDAEEMVNMLQKLIPNTGTSGTSGTTSTRQQGTADRQLVLEGGSSTGGREQLSFTTDKRTNAVIAAGTKGYLDLVEQLVYELDRQPIEDRSVFVYQPRNNKATEIQTMLANYSDKEKSRLQELGQEISSSAKTSREIVAIATEETNRLIVSYDPRRQSEVLDLVRQLDQAPPQVMIQVLIVEVSMTNSLELGVEFAFQDLQFTKAGAGDTTSYDYVGGTDVGAAVGDLGGFTFTITGQDFNFLIRTLQSEGQLNVLSRPQIIALDNQEAKIEITNRVPVVTGSTTVAGQTQTVTSYEEVGIKLTVTPHINPDGFVRMEVNQEVSDVSGSAQISQGVSQPTFLKRIADTSVTVKDNETVVLGGLIRKREVVSEAKVPLIGDIPIVGQLFRADDRESEHTELLVILTPRVVRSLEDYRELSIEERDRTGVLPDETLTSPLLQGLRIEPGQLVPRVGDEPIGAPRAPIPPKPAQPEDDVEIYGPLKKAAPKPAEPAPAEQHAEPASYDVPLTRATKK